MSWELMSWRSGLPCQTFGELVLAGWAKPAPLSFFSFFFFLFFLFYTLLLSNGNFSPGKFGSLSPRKASCNRVAALPNPN